MRAAKKKILEDLEGEGLLGPGLQINIIPQFFRK